MSEQRYRVCFRLYDLDDIKSESTVSKACRVDIGTGQAYILDGKLTDLPFLNSHCDYWLEPV